MQESYSAAGSRQNLKEQNSLPADIHFPLWLDRRRWKRCPCSARGNRCYTNIWGEKGCAVISPWNEVKERNGSEITHNPDAKRERPLQRHFSASVCCDSDTPRVPTTERGREVKTGKKISHHKEICAHVQQAEVFKASSSMLLLK